MFILLYFNLSSLAVVLRIPKELYAVGIISFFLLVFLIHSVRKKEISFNFKVFILSIIMIANILITIIVNQDFNFLNFYVISKIIISLFVCSIITFDNFVRNYVNVMFFFSLYSLIIMYVIVPFFPFLSSLFPTRINEAGAILRDYIFGFHFEYPLTVVFRNTGIFWEPGAFQFFTNLALIFELFIINNQRKRYLIIIVFILTTLSTFSSTGILQLFLILLAYFFKIKTKSELKRFFKLFFIFLILFGIILKFFPLLLTYINFALNKLNENSFSFKVRTASIVGNILAWLKNPLIGNGIDKGFSLALELYLGKFDVNNTSTTTSFLAVYGFFFAIIISFGSIALLFKRTNAGFFSKIILVLVFLLSINSERFIFDQFFYVLSFSYFMRSENNFINK